MKKLNKTLLIGGVSLALLVPVSIVAASNSMSGNGRGNGQNQNNSQQMRQRQAQSGVVANGAAGRMSNGMSNGMGRGAGGSSGSLSNLQTQLEALPKATLTADERAGLLRMREEEKLAHDVYVVLDAKWNAQVFHNIAIAEQTHSDEVKLLLDRYGITDPAAGEAAGTFTNPDLQALYTTLVQQGSTSLDSAFTVGATIEDLDLADLQAHATTTPDINLVYSNLERGSRNHLRAFSTQLERDGLAYTPTHITQAAYDTIVAGTMERGPLG
jgi:hypothetical protein